MGRLIQKFRLQKYSDTFGRGRASLLEFLHCLKYLFNLCSLSSEDSEADHFPPFHAVSNKFLLRNPLLSRYADLRLVRSRISSVLTSPVVGVSWHCKNYCSMSSTWNENFISVAQFTCPHESYEGQLHRAWSRSCISNILPSVGRNSLARLQGPRNWERWTGKYNERGLGRGQAPIFSRAFYLRVFPTIWSRARNRLGRNGLVQQRRHRTSNFWLKLITRPSKEDLSLTSRLWVN